LRANAVPGSISEPQKIEVIQSLSIGRADPRENVPDAMQQADCGIDST
jgi:hypothetical protein